MSKTVRVLKMVSEYVDSLDGTDSYEMPKGWRSITLEELALSKFNNETPAFIEHRQFNWHSDIQPYSKKRITAILHWYHDKTGVAFNKEWVYNPTKKEGQWEISCFAFGCKHQFKELSQEECLKREFPLPHYGMCWHVHECKLCDYVDSYDSSD
jgi:hypothetical protein